MKVADKQQVKELLEGHGILPTAQRVELGLLLFARPQHLSAEQLMNAAQSNGQSTVSKATVYNTLNLFAERGLLREVIVDPTKVFYDSNLISHGHVYNLDTGEISDIALPEVPCDLFAGLPEGTVAVGVDVVVRVRNSN